MEDDPSLDGAVLALPSTDTVKVVDQRGVIIDTPDRRTLWMAQTPQIFRRRVLLEAYEAARRCYSLPRTTHLW